MNKKILSIFALIMALSFAVSCSNEESTGTGGNNNQNKNIGTITFEPDATQIANGVKIVNLNAQTVASDTGTALTIKIDGAAADGYTYAVTKAERVTEAVNGETASVDAKLTAAAFKYDGAKIYVVQDTDLTSSWTGGSSIDAYLVTITLSKTGYNNKDVTVYVVLKEAAA